MNSELKTHSLAAFSLLRGACHSPAPIVLVLFAIHAVTPASGIAQSQNPATGMIEGRVSSAATGAALGNAKVAIEGGNLETTSNDDGSYRIRGVGTGRVTLTVSYVGYERKSLPLDIPSNGIARQDVELSLSGRDTVDQAGQEAVKLDAYTVVEQREVTARALAMNEQKSAPSIRNVVALDEYGDLGQENVGEFLRFLPGVAVGSSGLTPSDISVRGMPADTTQIMVDGNLMLDAQPASRNVPPQVVPLGNISRVEVTKVPTPDMPANALGGFVNLIRKGGFETRNPRLRYKLYELINTDSGITFGGGPRGMHPDVSPKYNVPSFELSYQRPLSENLALSAAVGSTWRKRGLRGRDETPTWDLVNLFQRTSQWSHLRSIVKTRTGQAGFDWKVSPHGTMAVNFDYKDGWVFVPRNQLTFNYGAGATGGATFTQGAATGVGNVTSAGTNVETRNRNRLLSARYTFQKDDWEVVVGGSYKDAKRIQHDVSNGHFRSVTSNTTNLVIRGEGIGENGSTIPARFTAVNRSGQPVDVFDLGTYTINSVASSENDFNAEGAQARIDLKRGFGWVSLKSGVAYNLQERDNRAGASSFNFRPNGSSSADARRAGLFDVFDDAYNAVTNTVNGNRARWINESKVYQLYRQHPDWFVENLATSHINGVNNSRELREEITAGYLRADLRLLSNRLWVVAGARYENTETEGSGALNDPNARYVRNAAGEIVRNSAGQPVLISADPVEQARLQYTERGAHSLRRYDGVYPSLNGTFNLSDAMLLRFAYARTIGRPDLNFIIPGITIPESDASPRTFTVVNTGLKPWTADNYDLSLESYQFKGGFGSIGVFQKDIKDFFNVVTTEATPELGARFGIPVDELMPGDMISTRINGGDARVRGFEFSYRQRLTFLPFDYGRSIEVFFNKTKLTLKGDRAADFSDFTPENYVWGVSLVRPRYSLKFTQIYQGEIRGALQAVSAADGIPPDTYNYQGARRRLSVSGEYSFSKYVSVFGSLSDIGGLDTFNTRYAPSTPEYAKPRRFVELGQTLTIGIKGEF